MALLSTVMSRVHARLEPAEFIEAVAIAFQEARNRESVEVMDQRFRREASFQLFQKALGLALMRGGPAQSVLVLGCGRGFAGETADFAARVVQESFASPRGLQVRTLNVTPRTCFQAPELAGTERTWDLVVTHSLLHYIPNLGPVFDLIRRALSPSGGLIVSHEPNARFWQSPECQAMVANLRKARRLLRLRRRLRPSHLFRRFRTKAQPVVSVSVGVNRYLAERHELSAPLTDEEIRRLVDVHRPGALPGTFRIGLNGFDTDDLGKIYLPDFRLLWTGSSGHLGYADASVFPPEWQRIEATLAAKQPLAGSVFTAYWSRDRLR